MTRGLLLPHNDCATSIRRIDSLHQDSQEERHARNAIRPQDRRQPGQRCSGAVAGRAAFGSSAQIQVTNLNFAVTDLTPNNGVPARYLVNPAQSLTVFNATAEGGTGVPQADDIEAPGFLTPGTQIDISLGYSGSLAVDQSACGSDPHCEDTAYAAIDMSGAHNRPPNGFEIGVGGGGELSATTPQSHSESNTMDVVFQSDTPHWQRDTVYVQVVAGSKLVLAPEPGTVELTLAGLRALGALRRASPRAARQPDSRHS